MAVDGMTRSAAEAVLQWAQTKKPETGRGIPD